MTQVTYCYKHGLWHPSSSTWETLCQMSIYIHIIVPLILLVIKAFLTLPCFIYLLGEVRIVSLSSTKPCSSF